MKLIRICAAALLLGAGAARAASQQDASIEAGGLTRQYIVVTPDTLPAGPRPLVIVLHGHLGTAANALGEGARPSPLSAWVGIADREGILVAALQGLKGRDNHSGWHDCRIDAVENPQADDVAFVRAVIAGLVQSGRADPRRVYIMGMSNGAMMALRLALELRPAPAAVAAVSGSMAVHSACAAAAAPVSVLLIGGTDDPIVPYAGGKVGVKDHRTGEVSGAAASRDFWLQADGLSGAPASVADFPHRLAADPTRAHRETWGPASGPQVELLTLQGGGHVEPSLRYHYGWVYSGIVGRQNQDLESAEEAWSFFKDKASR
jgi:polyhydroxybutyrate depolymerase